MVQVPYIRISSLPSNGGALITDVEAQLNGTGSISLGARAAGDYYLPGADVGDDVAIRAVNSAGALAFAGLPTKTVPEDPNAPTLFDMTTLFSTEDGIYYDIRQESLATTAQATGLTDLSPNGHNATLDSGVTAPIVRDDGTRQFIRTTSAHEWYRIPGMQLGSDVTMVFAMRHTVQTDTGSLIRAVLSAADVDSILPSVNWHNFAFTQNSADQVRSIIGNGTSVDRVDLTDEPQDNTLKVITYRKTGTTGEIFINGTLRATATQSRTSGFNTGNYALFANPPQIFQERAVLTDFIGSVIINRSLNATELANASDPVNWGI